MIELERWKPSERDPRKLEYVGQPTAQEVFEELKYRLESMGYLHVEFFGEFPVALVMGRNCHDGACSIAHKYIIGNPDGNFLPIDRIDGGKTIDHHTGLFLGKLCALKIGFSGSHLPVGGYLIPIFNISFIFLDRKSVV